MVQEEEGYLTIDGQEDLSAMAHSAHRACILYDVCSLRATPGPDNLAAVPNPKTPEVGVLNGRVGS